MKKTVAKMTEDELRQIIREEVRIVINETNEPATELPEGFLNTDQAADLIKLKKTTVYNLINQNKIPFHKSGKRVLFRRSELIAWISENKGGE